jgi:hypothetical protein
VICRSRSREILIEYLETRDYSSISPGDCRCRFWTFPPGVRSALRRKADDREASLVRILIVDDHPIVISRCRALLGAESGVEVIDAPDGAAGFAAFFKAKPDVTLSRVIPASRAGAGSASCGLQHE